jgi:hypothetical protein
MNGPDVFLEQVIIARRVRDRRTDEMGTSCAYVLVKWSISMPVKRTGSLLIPVPTANFVTEPWPMGA